MITGSNNDDAGCNDDDAGSNDDDAGCNDDDDDEWRNVNYDGGSQIIYDGTN